MSSGTHPFKWWVIASAVIAAALCGVSAALLMMYLHVAVPGIVGIAFGAFVTSGTFFLAIAKAGGLVH
ncbi:hypothetical protein ACFXJO_03830 [Streptomyces lavendulae]|uniref:hypothetical protein n=1 Tax=Streptomyces lavendulae TaxID=1914 RepID=UPI0036A9813E